MTRLPIWLGLVFAWGLAGAQDVQWASSVLDFSSQLSDYEYAASQVLDKPDVLPNPEDNPNAWLPDNPDRISFIKVGFDEPMSIEQIAVAESYHPGAVYQIFLYEPNGNEHLLTTLNPRELEVKGRMLNIYVNKTPYEVSAVKVVIDGSKVPGYNAIDAIGISGTKVPVVAERDIALRRNPGLDEESLPLNYSAGESDTRPVFVKKLNQLFFTRGFSPENAGLDTDPGDIWFAELNRSTGNWKQAAPLPGSVNNIGLSTVGGYFEMDGREYLLLGNISGKVNKVTSNLVLVTQKNRLWENFYEQKIRRDNIASFDADYAMAGNGAVLFISTLRYDTEGGRDLYISYRDGNNKWSEPENMGEEINTAHHEYSPFYSESEKALYFSTAGYSSYGQGDIYRVIRQDDSWTNWSVPENIGPDVNTGFDEKYFYFDEEDEHAYFARSGEDSVYRIVRIDRPRYMEPTPMVVLRGKVSDAESGEPLNAEISVDLLPENNPFGITIADQSGGEYEIQLPSGNQYRVTSEKEGFEPYQIKVALENKDQSYGYELDIPLVAMGKSQPSDTGPIAEAEAGETTDPGLIAGEQEAFSDTEEADDGRDRETSGTSSVSDVVFDFNSVEPVEASLPILDRIADFLSVYPDVKIEIAGFTDHIGSELFNADLATKRAISVKNYLVKAGISAKRIKVIGFGEKMPLIVSNDIRDLQVNRRVEFNFTRY